MYDIFSNKLHLELSINFNKEKLEFQFFSLFTKPISNILVMRHLTKKVLGKKSILKFFLECITVLIVMEFWWVKGKNFDIFSLLEAPISHSAGLRARLHLKFFLLSTCGHDLSVLGPPNIIIMTLCNCCFKKYEMPAYQMNMNKSSSTTKTNHLTKLFFICPVGTSFLLTCNLSDLDINDYSWENLHHKSKFKEM